VGERKQRAKKTAGRSASAATHDAGRKACIKKASARAAKNAATKKADPKARKAGNVKDAEARKIVEERPRAVIDPNEHQAERRNAGDSDAPQATGNGCAPKLAATPASPAARNTGADQRPKPGASAEAAARPNTLVPTNGIHVTERRIRRRPHQNRTMVFLVAATLLGIVILGEQTEPPDMTAFEQQIAARQADGPRSNADAAPHAAASGAPAPEGRQTASLGEDDMAPERSPGARPWELDAHELAETERLLARLGLAPSVADGMIDLRTEQAIRLYQQIAGLPIDGEPSRALLADLREVVRILDNGG
jgi:hypothetical protein